MFRKTALLLKNIYSALLYKLSRLRPWYQNHIVRCRHPRHFLQEVNMFSRNSFWPVSGTGNEKIAFLLLLFFATES
ncbi:hypothetical protein ACET3Z_007546 [Daucus carota]